MRPELPKDPDALLALARAAARKRRKWSPVAVLVALAVLAAVLGLVVWSAWPREEPPPLQVIAFDQFTPRGEPATLRGRLVPVGDEAEPVDLAGQELFFAESLLGGGGGVGGRAVDQRLQARETTGADGEASVSWGFPPGRSPASYVVRFQGDGRQARSHDQAHIFIWPADAAVLVVEARHALLDLPPGRFRKTSLPDLRPAAGAVAALQEAARNYRIIYLAVGPARPIEYPKLRSWLQQPAPPGGQWFPQGPALGRPTYSAETDEAAAQRAVLQDLNRRCRGRLAGVVRRARDARVFRDEGLTTLLIGEPKHAPARVTAVKSWREVPGRLPRR